MKRLQSVLGFFFILSEYRLNNHHTRLYVLYKSLRVRVAHGPIAQIRLIMYLLEIDALVLSVGRVFVTPKLFARGRPPAFYYTVVRTPTAITACGQRSRKRWPKPSPRQSFPDR